jgi:hypothetical protein
MNEQEYAALVRSVIEGWTDHPGRRAAIAALGLAITVYAIARALRARRLSALPSIVVCLAVMACLGMALYPAEILGTLTHVEYASRSRFLLGMASGLVIVITIEAIRQESLRERYALLWLTTGFVILTVVLFPESLAFFRAVTGMDYWSALGAVAFIFFTLLAFHFSLTISRMHGQITKLTQRLAIAETELRNATAGKKAEVPPGGNQDESSGETRRSP